MSVAKHVAFLPERNGDGRIRKDNGGALRSVARLERFQNRTVAP